MRKLLPIFFVSLLYLTCLPKAGALAISGVELESNLNQPLHARIYLLAVAKDELDSLNISVKDISDVPGSQRFTAYRHEIKQSDQGHYINITTREAIREPILNFILELNWSTGRLIREYSLIIDLQ